MPVDEFSNATFINPDYLL